MSGYSDDPRMVRVDIWKASGKWYSTVAMKWVRYHNYKPHDSKENFMTMKEVFLTSFLLAFPGSFKGMTATCLEPYHSHSYPVMIVIPE